MQFRVQRVLPYAPDALFDLVWDVKSYPSFVPWCKALRVLEQRPNRMRAEMLVGVKAMQEPFLSEVEASEDRRTITMRSIRGPFKLFRSEWQFAESAPQSPESLESLESGGTPGSLVDFSVDFRFRSRLFEKVLGMLFENLAEKTIHAFALEADRRLQ